MASMADSVRLALFTLVWTAIWVAPLPRLGRWPELVAGLVPFTAFGLRVFAGFFVGVAADDPVRSAVHPLLDWIDGRAGFPPYVWVLDATVALGLVWLASAFDIPRRSRIATAAIIPVVAVLATLSLWRTGLPIERLLASRLPVPLLALTAGSLIGAVVRWTSSPLSPDIRQRAAIVATLVVPVAAVVGQAMLHFVGRLPPEHASQADSIVALVAGAGAGFAGWSWGGFVRSRSRSLFAMAVGVAAGAVVGFAR
jgi:fluoride ion exporter CrcB/FEX